MHHTSSSPAAAKSNESNENAHLHQMRAETKKKTEHNKNHGGQCIPRCLVHKQFPSMTPEACIRKAQKKRIKGDPEKLPKVFMAAPRIEALHHC
jgi:hypothetical protein